MRQQKDLSFSDLLNHVRIGKQTEQDIRLLESRMVAGNNIDLSKPPFEKALRMFSCVADCNAFNEGELMKLSSTIPIFGPPEGGHILFLLSPEVTGTSGTMSLYIYIYIYIYINNMAHAKSVHNLLAIFR